ncbi:trehalose-phosphatase [Cellulomonas cellasea]|uniref:Trehalose 6-phosphate phosphatase n=2 Tax=Cellulomonas cellasea TaxID=43670 RepID=A0A0A0B0Z4_9CELL|nr:trehalose-phosphatase [Cellulomonas cellasea]KGM00455.1 haloacid dehalogenase [Cellulomonas cellasea DSM 20118]GEA88161.1 trehalose 6-phosphate phosphatase [Cellulomonas cellasea]
MSEPRTATTSPTGSGPDDDRSTTLAALSALAADTTRRPLLVALDFDGVLAPLQDDPSASRILPRGVTALEALGALPDEARVRIALVSGRAMADLHALAQVPPGTFLVGSHGAERARVTTFGLDRDVVQLSDEQADRLAALGAQTASVARGRDGVWVETKPTAVVVHTRLAERDVAETAEREALAIGAELGSGVLHGKDVVEISVLHASKGEAITALRTELGADVVVYAGDDVTDEHAFAALGPDDVTVKVGAGDTVARFRLATPDDVVEALDLLSTDLGAPRG